MAKKKYYAVKNGRINGIYLSWEDCKKMIDGFSNASYKSFEDPYMAVDFLIGSDLLQEKNSSTRSVVAYVDGSYNIATKDYGYGGVILLDGEEIYQFSEKGIDENARSMRNVAGEIEASMHVMKYCIDNNFDEVSIHYDYTGIEKWCLGEWKTNKDKTKAYKEYYDSIKNRLKVNFIKVKSHSGDYYNDIADKLAKKSIF